MNINIIGSDTNTISTNTVDVISLTILAMNDNVIDRLYITKYKIISIHMIANCIIIFNANNKGFFNSLIYFIIFLF